MIKYRYLVLGVSLLLMACKDGTEVENMSSVPITLLANIGSVGVDTRGDGVIGENYAGALLANFARLNQTGVTAEAVPTFPLYTEAAAIAPLVANRASGSNVINFTSPQNYPTDATYKNTKMVGWYPSTTAAINPSSYAAGVVTFTLDGSTDVMLTNEVTGSSDANNKFSDAGHLFTFAHQLTQLQFKVYAEDDVAAGVWGTVTSISVKDQFPTCTIALPSGVTFSGTTRDVAVSNVSTAALPVTSATAAASGSVMIPPITTAAAGQTVTLHVVTSKGIADVTLDASAGLFQSKAYAYTLKFTKRGITAAAGQVANWITGISNNYEVDASTQTVNLSAAETANSYIAKPGGTYKFNATVEGNGVTTTVNSVPVITPTAITPSSASVLWQSSDGLISGTPTLSADGYVTFSTNAAAEGNAVIAVKDGSNNILWSWHIWVANYNPNATTYTYNSNVFMDRNLGATTAVAATPLVATTLGLMYQWGRKDPFPNSTSPTGNIEPTLFGEKTSVSREAVAASNNLTNSIQNPLKFYTGNDWYQTGGTKNDNLWGTSKTIYDPCPPGWHVPAFSGSTSPWSGLTVADGGTWTSGYTWNFSYYPANGYRDSNGNIGDVGSGGHYWSASATGTNAYDLSIGNGYVNASYNLHNRAYGFGVRCVKI